MSDHLHLLRVTIEAVSPISSGTGASDLYDMVLSRDANGLPEIAGSSLQGVLRHLYDAEVGANANKLFGFAEGDQGATGRLFFGFGRVHDSTDTAVTGRVGGAPQFPDDDLLRMLAAEAPLQRDHVALSDRHVAAGRAKFERIAVPRGTRFSFEIAMVGEKEARDSDEKEALLKLLWLFGHPAFRLGGAARRGYGKVKVERAGYRALPLSEPDTIRKVRAQPASRNDTGAGFEDVTTEVGKGAGSAVTVTLRLSPIGLWRVGSTGDPTRTEDTELRSGGLVDEGRGGPDRREKDVDAAPVREPWIDWATGSGTWYDPWRRGQGGKSPDKVTFTIPGTAIKGPLAHRTMFHWNRASGIMIGDAELERATAIVGLPEGTNEEKEAKRRALRELRKQIAKMAERNDTLKSLFGAIKDKQDEKKADGAESGAGETPADGAGARPEPKGRAARLIVDDATVEVDRATNIGALDHNSIDRFTGGVRNRLLYSEEAVYGGAFDVTLTILPAIDADGNKTNWDARVITAFCAALADLVDGRLALGAKSLGFCEGGEPAFTGDGSEAWSDAWAKMRHERPVTEERAA